VRAEGIFAAPQGTVAAATPYDDKSMARSAPVTAANPLPETTVPVEAVTVSGRDSDGDSGEVSDADLIDALRQVIDPELMVNIVDLGLVYSVNQTESRVLVEMTLTSPACPAGPQIIQQAKMVLERIPAIHEAQIKLTMSPPWTPDRMTDEARDQLGFF